MYSLFRMSVVNLLNIFIIVVNIMYLKMFWKMDHVLSMSSVWEYSVGKLRIQVNSLIKDNWLFSYLRKS